MPWEKSFDTDEVLERATAVFWAKGYEATSMADLLAATRINKGSLYNAFGSKKALFTLSLLKYDREQSRGTLARLKAMNDPVAAIEALFDGLIAQSLNDPDKKGCMLINTALDLPNHDEDIVKAVKAGIAEFEAFFVEQLKAGRESGAIPAHVDPKTTAKGLLTLVTGLRVLARGVFDEAGLKAIKAQALDLIR